MVTRATTSHEDLPNVGEMVQVPFGRNRSMATVWEIYGPSDARYALVEQHLHGAGASTEPHLITIRLSRVVPLRCMSDDEILDQLRVHRPKSRRDDWDWEPKKQLYDELRCRDYGEPTIDELVFSGRRNSRQTK